MLTILCWKWGTKYHPDHVNRLYHSVRLNLTIPFQFTCIADTAFGLDPDINVIDLPNTLGKLHSRRLWIFSRPATQLGSRILQLDLDTVITDDITPLVTRDEPIVIWKHPMTTRFGYGLNPSFLLFTPGLHTDIWTNFFADPDAAILAANRAGFAASDQAIISQHFSRITGPKSAEPTIPVYTTADGIFSIRDVLTEVRRDGNRHITHNLHPCARLISFYGRFDPAQFTHLPWVKKHWVDII